MKKTYVLDTNVLLSDSQAMFSFQENDVIIPLIVLEELDNHKTRHDEVGSIAREINRTLDELRSSGSLLKGIELRDGGILRVQKYEEDTNMPLEFDKTKVDNKIIAYMLSNPGYVLISKDINVRIKCDALGVKCEDYRKTKIATNKEDFYQGVSTIEVAEHLVDMLHEDGKIEYHEDWNLCPIEIAVLKHVDSAGNKKTAICRYIQTREGLHYVKKVIEHDGCSGLKTRNKEQNFCLELLYDPEVKFVTLAGPSGTGKTLFALAAGLNQHERLGIGSKTKQASYARLVATRSVMPIGNDIGFLPGTLFEKMEPWLAPICDNLSFLLNKNKKTKPRLGSKGQKLDPMLTSLMESGDIEVESIAHIRGRSIPNSYIIIDEAQNLTLHELKTIVTRVGEGSKIVLTGDIDQIDNVSVDVYTNGLTYAIEKFKNSRIAGHVTLRKGERSELATEASRIL